MLDRKGLMPKVRGPQQGLVGEPVPSAGLIDVYDGVVSVMVRNAGAVVGEGGPTTGLFNGECLVYTMLPDGPGQPGR